MYSAIQLVKKYVHYYINASSSKGHGVHSPFVFDFITNVLNDRTAYDCYDSIEEQRKQLLSNAKVIKVEDFGAGSAVIKTNRRVVHKIASSSLKHSKYARLLYRIVQHYRPYNIIELGTSFGISTAYMANANPEAMVYTLEGAASIAEIARQNFEMLAIKNIQLREGSFEQTLQPLLSEVQNVGLAFVDGNHRKEPTLQYFRQLVSHSTSATILVFDDIHWSEEMEEVWAEIRQHPAVTLTIDLFFIGLVFLNPDFKIKQHFKIRF
ncbi:MAG: class I SAM-dependent methyltransferase [Ferruginibacter sp.]